LPQCRTTPAWEAGEAKPAEAQKDLSLAAANIKVNWDEKASV